MRYAAFAIMVATITAPSLAFADDKSGERPARSNAEGGAKVDDKSGERPARSNAEGGAKVDDKSGERPARSNAEGGAKVDDKSGERPARSNAEGGAKVDDKSGERPARSNAEGGAKVDDKSGERPARSNAEGGAKVDDKSGERPARSNAEGGAKVDDKADCEYLEISATTSKAPAIDPELKALDKKLKKPPFASWNTFHKLSGGPISLAKQKAETLKLAQGGASLLLRDRSEKRLEITVTIDGPDGKRVLDNKQSLAVGDWSVWGHSLKDDGHILALTCK